MGKDFLYRDNRFVDSSTVRLSRGFLWRRRLVWFVRASVFVLVVAGGVYAGVCLLNPSYRVGDERVSVVEVSGSGLNVGDRVVFYREEDLPDRGWLDRFASWREYSEGRVVTLPHGLSKGSGEQLDGGVFEVECLRGACAKGEFYKIGFDAILGGVS